MHTFLHLPLFLASDWAAAFKVFVLTPSDSFSLFLFICTVVQSVNFLPVLYMISSRRHVPYMSALWSNLNKKAIMENTLKLLCMLAFEDDKKTCKFEPCRRCYAGRT